MDPVQISFAVVMVGVAIASVVWLQTSQAAASAKRMKGMMMRLGLDYGMATGADRRAVTIVQEARRRCRKCPREDLCDRWLAGKVKGDNSFCPNMQTFRLLSEAGGRID